MGNLTNVDYPSSADVSFGYDWLNRLTEMVDGLGTTKYAYTAGNQLWTEDGPFDSDTVTNMYANRKRLPLRSSSRRLEGSARKGIKTGDSSLA